MSTINTSTADSHAICSLTAAGAGAQSIQAAGVNYSPQPSSFYFSFHFGNQRSRPSHPIVIDQATHGFQVSTSVSPSVVAPPRVGETFEYVRLDKGEGYESVAVLLFPHIGHVALLRDNAKSHSSRSHTLVDSYYPPSGSHSRWVSAVIPDVTHLESVSSTRSATYKGSDGERTCSDSDKRNEDMSNGLGPPPIAKVSSIYNAIGSGDALSSNWKPLPVSSSRSPFINPPHSAHNPSTAVMYQRIKGKFAVLKYAGRVDREDSEVRER
ncbi:hypothetical protein BYT27DRAFT_7265736 [Phlegmacium glaucopus]|nr:hypothetical protein BYT27DRAFT_7265736 [Phlegmacium glaucopus]